MKARFTLAVSISLAASLAGCEGYQVSTTRNEIYKLAFRTAQFQKALEKCEADPKLLEKHETRWAQNFAAAAKWLEMDPAAIAARQEAGREGLADDAGVACAVVLGATKISFAAAKRWSQRIEDEEYCSITSCD